MLAIYARKERLLLWVWASAIPLSDATTVKVSVQRSNRLDTIDWRAFASRLKTFYKQRGDAYLKKINATRPAPAPSLLSLAPDRVALLSRKSASLLDEDVIVNVYADSVTLAIKGTPCGVIDCGRKSQDDVIAWLDAHETRELSFVALSHLHYDHFAGLAAVTCGLDRLDYLFVPPMSLLSGASGQLARFLHEIQRLHAAGTSVIPYSTPKQRLILQGKPEICLDVLFPSNAFLSAIVTGASSARRAPNVDYNALCAIHRITVGKSSFLITADTNRKAWREVLPLLSDANNSDELRGLILPHHGSRNALEPEMLDELFGDRGFVAVLQLMPFNPYGLPHDEVIGWVRERKGTIVVTHERHASVRLTPSAVHLG